MKKIALSLALALATVQVGGEDVVVSSPNQLVFLGDAVKTSEDKEISFYKTQIRRQIQSQNAEQVKVSRWNVPISDDLQDYIHQLCKKYHVDEKLAYAVMYKETGGTFNPKLISSTSDFGLFQINQVNIDLLEYELGIVDVLDPYQNVKGGIYLLSKLNKYDISSALVAYNMGEPTMLNKNIHSTPYSRDVIDIMNNKIHKE